MWTAKNRPRYNRDKLGYPSDLTEEEWALVEPQIPSGKRGGGKRRVNMREVVNGVMYPRNDTGYADGEGSIAVAGTFNLREGPTKLPGENGAVLRRQLNFGSRCMIRGLRVDARKELRSRPQAFARWEVRRRHALSGVRARASPRCISESA
jgi:hypothetical protein